METDADITPVRHGIRQAGDAAIEESEFANSAELTGDGTLAIPAARDIADAIIESIVAGRRAQLTAGN